MNTPFYRKKKKKTGIQINVPSGVEAIILPYERVGERDMPGIFKKQFKITSSTSLHWLLEAPKSLLTVPPVPPSLFSKSPSVSVSVSVSVSFTIDHIYHSPYLPPSLTQTLPSNNEREREEWLSNTSQVTTIVCVVQIRPPPLPTATTHR